MSGERKRDRTPSIRRTVAALIRRRPAVVLPFVLLGVLAACVNALRLWDPVPTAPRTADQRGLIHVTFELFPGVTDSVSTPIGATLGLEPRWFLWVLGLEGVVVFAGVAAMVAVVTLSWPARSDPLDGFRRLALFEIGVLGAWIALQVAALSDFVGGLVVLPVVLAWIYLAVRWFTVPALLATGTGLRTALRESGRRTWLSGWYRLGLLALFGLVANLLVSVPVLAPAALPLPVGTALATGVVGTLYALTLVAAVDERSWREESAVERR